ncbi:hypothetical protein [Streptosporangium sp. NPDC049078]|uniref:hypothetical protein n=1 Tax=Streptosporangium sp. NPDC049078 TaxID=3155767 RepID=UPI0034351321
MTTPDLDGTCGDCATGKCHGTEPDDCGCARHDASVNAHLDACMECGGDHGEAIHYDDRCFGCGEVHDGTIACSAQPH